MFELNDDSVAVVIGSGAGGGTISHQLAQKGIKVVCLEAGKRLTMGDIINDEAAMFAKLTWQDPRIGEGDAPADFPVTFAGRDRRIDTTLGELYPFDSLQNLKKEVPN